MGVVVVVGAGFVVVVGAGGGAVVVGSVKLGRLGGAVWAIATRLVLSSAMSAK